MTAPMLQTAALDTLRPGSCWAMRPDALAAVMAAARGTLRPPTAHGDEAEEQAALGRARPSARGGVAVLPLTGVVTPYGSFLSLLFGGGGGLQTFREQLADAATDADVAAIVLHVDSPGGVVDLVPETAADLRAAREIKPVVAVASTLAASAAYWIAAQADEVVVTPSGEVGSIGVYIAHTEFSAMDEAMGVTTTLVTAGEHKAEFNAYEPLGDEAREELQRRVDGTHDLFIADVALGRGVTEQKVRDDFGRGRTMRRDDAVAAGLADRVDTLEATVARAVSGDVQRRPVSPAAATLDAGTLPPPPSPAPTARLAAEDRRRIAVALGG